MKTSPSAVEFGSISFAIGLVSMATLIFELVVNKVLIFSTWGTLGYMIIGSAIFGFVIAGVLVGIRRPRPDQWDQRVLSRWLTLGALGFSGCIVVAYLTMNVVPFSFSDLPLHPLRQTLYFTIWYLALLGPFVASGFVISALLIRYKERANWLYGFDLVGAGLGCIILVPLFPLIGPEGEYLLCAAMGCLCAVLFSFGNCKRLAAIAGFFMMVCVSFVPFAQELFPVRTHQEKRARWEDWQAGNIKDSSWSYLSKIEVGVPPLPKSGMLWFDGGMMMSSIDPFRGDYEQAKRSPLTSGANSIAYRLRPRDCALIIGSAGGREVRAALAWGTDRVFAIELDPSVVRIVREDLNSYLGGLYNDPRVSLINDEGRSFVRRNTRKFDVIQMVSSYSVSAQHAGALTQLSSYLTTVEAFDDYFNHLTPEGVLSISMNNDLRLFLTGWQSLLARNLDPSGRMILLRNDDSTFGINTLLVKLSNFSNDEMVSVKSACIERAIRIMYAPEVFMEQVDRSPGLSSEPRARRLIEEFLKLSASERKDYPSHFPYKVFPTTDDKPFYEDVGYAFRKLTERPELLTEERLEMTKSTAYRFMPLLPIGMLPSIFVLFESALVAVLALVVPLRRHRAIGLEKRWQQLSMVYFLALGLGFIWIEILCLKEMTLFLGSPVYSVSVVLCAMLTAAGIGSLLSGKLQGSIRNKLRILICLLLMLPVLHILQNRLIFELLGLPIGLRCLVAVVLMFPLGIILGMFFPTGLTYLSTQSPDTIPWAWAANGYATVVGVSSAALLAPWIGFSLLFYLSIGIYLIGVLALLRAEQSSSVATIREALGEEISRGGPLEPVRQFSD